MSKAKHLYNHHRTIDITTPSPSPSVHGLLFTLSPSLSPANLQQLNCKTHTSDTNTIIFIPTIIFWWAKDIPVDLVGPYCELKVLSEVAVCWQPYYSKGCAPGNVRPQAGHYYPSVRKLDIIIWLSASWTLLSLCWLDIFNLSGMLNCSCVLWLGC